MKFRNIKEILEYYHKCLMPHDMKDHRWILYIAREVGKFMKDVKPEIIETENPIQAIWTAEENEIRKIENMFDHTDETCKTCQWSNHEKGKKFFTCGHHIENFTHNSWCSYHTPKNDPKLLAYYEKMKNEIRKK